MHTNIQYLQTFEKKKKKRYTCRTPVVLALSTITMIVISGPFAHA